MHRIFFQASVTHICHNKKGNCLIFQLPTFYHNSCLLYTSSIRYGLAYGYLESIQVGFPIRIPADQWIFAPPRSFSPVSYTHLPYLPRRLQGVLLLTNGISHLEGGFTLRCLQRLSLPGLSLIHIFSNLFHANSAIRIVPIPAFSIRCRSFNHKDSSQCSG